MSEAPCSNRWRASVHCPKCQREIDHFMPMTAIGSTVWLWANARRDCVKCGPVATVRKANLIFGYFPALVNIARGIESNDNNDEKETGT